MSEHAVYSSAEAVPVHIASRVWPARPGFTHARDLVRVSTGFSRAEPWAFRSIRHPEAKPAIPAAEPLFLSGSHRIHLRHSDLRRPISESSFGQISAALTDPVVTTGPDNATRPRRISPHDIYTGHFGLTERPFALVPDPDFLFWSTEHQHTFAALEYGVLTRAPITLITGEIGAGKTLLIHQLLRTAASDVRIGLVSNTHGGPDEMLRWVMLALGQPAPADKSYPGLVAAFQDYLIAEYARGARVVLIFDEAQNLCAEALEELRLLTNINSCKDELLQLVLVGQPELRELVQRPGLEQFAQRVAASYHLSAMDAVTMRAYIAHRLRVAGVKSTLFSEAATDLIHQATGGIPRRVNQLCDLAMVYAFTSGQHSVVRFAVQQVLDDGTFFGANPVGAAPLMAAAE